MQKLSELPPIISAEPKIRNRRKPSWFSSGRNSIDWTWNPSAWRSILGSLYVYSSLKRSTTSRDLRHASSYIYVGYMMWTVFWRSPCLCYLPSVEFSRFFGSELHPLQTDHQLAFVHELWSWATFYCEFYCWFDCIQYHRLQRTNNFSLVVQPWYVWRIRVAIFICQTWNYVPLLVTVVQIQSIIISV